MSITGVSSAGGAYRAIAGGGSVAASAVLTITPPAGEEWVITEAGSTATTGTDPNKTPNIHVYTSTPDGASMVRPAGSLRPPMELVVTAMSNLQLTNAHTATAILCYSGYRMWPLS